MGKFFNKRSVENMNALRQGKGAYRMHKAGAKQVESIAKVNVLKAKADLAVARGATRRSVARSSAIASSVAAAAKAKSDAAKYSMENARNAISQWNALINQKAPAAEGTGEPSGPEPTDKTDVYPTGNN